jgi:hypothetical protein
MTRDEMLEQVNILGDLSEYYIMAGDLHRLNELNLFIGRLLKQTIETIESIPGRNQNEFRRL